MYTLKRKIELDDNVDDLFFATSQASINSDGVLTIRNYNPANKSNDVIYILSKAETNAIIRLFSQNGVLIRNNEIPF